MDKELHLYHGSKEIVRNPEYGLGRKHNDYGIGFYCTEDEDLVGEWACTSLDNGFANHYILDNELLNILDLDSEGFNILNWMAVLVDNRVFSIDTPLAGRARKYLKDNFYVNVNAYDVIIGNRADDAYYDFASAFLNNAITVEQLARALMPGKLGRQVVLKSKLAFDSIRFVDFDVADHRKYYPARKTRSERAEREFRDMCEEDADGLYMIDIIRDGISSGDERIPHIVRQR